LSEFLDGFFHNALLALTLYENGLMVYMPLTSGLKVGNLIFSGITTTSDKKFNGCSLLLKNIKLFSVINNIELYPFSGAILCRSAGVGAILISRINDMSILKLNSGWKLFVNNFSFATLGRVSNIFHKFLKFRKAGQKRQLGFRPTVRGLIKNPCDHPHGGGEGRGSPPSAPKSPWGWITKGCSSKRTLFHKKKKYKFKKF